MRGYVAKKGNRWYAVIYEGVDPTTGKERRRWVAAGTRKGDAEKLVTEMVKRRNEGGAVATDKSTFGSYLVDRWLPIQETKVRRSTYDSYRRTIELHVLPALADAHRKGLVVRNVATLADPPSVTAARRKQIKAWDATQLNVWGRASRWWRAPTSRRRRQRRPPAAHEAHYDRQTNPALEPVTQ